MVRDFYLVMVPGCNHLLSTMICLTLNVHCFYNFTYVIFDMYNRKFYFICDEKIYMTYSTQLHKRGKV